MIRRTFALAGAAVLTLGITGLAGPAAADDNGVQVDLEDVLINEVGIDLDGALDPDNEVINGTFVELVNMTENTIDLENWELRGCNQTSSFTIVTFGSTHQIDPGVSSFFLTADQTYSNSAGGDRENVLASSLAQLVQSGGGVELVDDSGTPLTDNIRWGTGVHFNCSSFDLAPDTPSDTESIDRTTATPWNRSNPTPHSQTGDKV